MGVNLIFKIAAVGILVSVMCQVLKHSGREDQAFLTSLAGLILVLFWIVPYIYELFETIKNLFSLWSLFVLRIFTDNSDTAFSLNNLALLANRFY